jgi:predicted molibdopterin-dependent oxidoreductase YjgC
LPNAGDEGKKFRELLRAEPNLLIVFGSEFRGRDIDALVSFGLGLPDTTFACLGDYVNSRGAADMGLLPGFLPGYVAVGPGTAFSEEYGGLPEAPGLDLVEMFDAAEKGELAALYVVGANPVSRYGVDPKVLKNTFVVVQDMFMTETAQLADVIFPTANLYEKAGTVTNTYGDQQLVKKAADRAGVRTDFELIVRLADAMGGDARKLVPFGRGVRADMGQTRGAQSGEADRHAVWLAAQSLEPKLSPFDPFAILDEVQRLVPSYQVSRFELLAGNDVHVQSPLVQIQPAPERHSLIYPAQDTLFTSGTLGRYSNMLHSVLESHAKKPTETAAD